MFDQNRKMRYIISPKVWHPPSSVRFQTSNTMTWSVEAIIAFITLAATCIPLGVLLWRLQCRNRRVQDDDVEDVEDVAPARGYPQYFPRTESFIILQAVVLGMFELHPSHVVLITSQSDSYGPGCRHFALHSCLQTRCFVPRKSKEDDDRKE
ncbi:hypothetical protein C7974DRAFT_401823 [Boeremia exigua]|uniref:uncharacterized protein n=1 Tax=Boeremia exigua TaxID=749465 RepID=UPI001E8D9A1C|nr:uncharacterized protein C7974DRAFT_401823 [Boeremia exigua]KAH6616455.1 hypothetical protein C7974DRAFT_401823 [Boeremia exigua]